MPLIDDRGRLFGRVNLIDAVVGVVVLGLIPLAYGAFLLFRVPVPKITTVAPTQVIAHQPGTIEITGEDLRPFLRARFGTFESKGFLVQSPTRAEIKLPDLPEGTYDLGLSDQGQELVLRPGALTVVAPPAPPVVLPPPPVRLDVQAVGAFIGLGRGDGGLIGMGSKFELRKGEAAAGAPTTPDREPAMAAVLALRAPEPGIQRVRIGPNVFATAPLPGELRVPAIIRLSCIVVNQECKIGDTVVAQNATVTLPWSSPTSNDKSARPAPDQVKFVIDEVRPAGTPAVFPPPPLPPPLPIDVQAVGAFVGLTSDDARLVSVGVKFERRRNEVPAFETATPGPGREGDAGNQGPIAEVLAVRPAQTGSQRVNARNVIVTTTVTREVRVPAIIRLSCRVANEDCKVGDTVVAQNATISLPWPPGDPSSQPRPREVRFLIDEVRPADARVVFPSVRTAVATVRVRFVAGPEVIDVMKVGDVDLSGSVVVPDADRAVLTEVGPEREALTALTNTEGLNRRSLQIEQPVLAFTGTVRVPVVFTPSGWSYRDRPVKVGAPFTFETLSGAMVGWILDTKLGPETVSVAP